MSHDSMQVDSPAQTRPEFSTAVMYMDNNLHDHDLESLKFLCQGLVIGSKLKPVKSMHELATCLQKANLVSADNYSLLADLLQYINRVDVLESIGYDEAEVIHQRHQHLSKIEPFLVLLFHIAEDVNDEDLKKARYKYGRVPESLRLSSALDLFALMIQHSTIGPMDVSLLNAIFQALERKDTVHMLNRYTETRGLSVLEDIEAVYRRKSLGLLGGRNGTTQSVSPILSQSFQQPADLRDSTGSADRPSNGRDRPSPQPFSSAALEHPSEENRLPCVPQTATSHGSLSQPPEANALSPQNTPQGFNQGADRLAVPEDFDERIITWQTLDTISRKIHTQYWPNFISRLGLHYMDTQRWVTNIPDHTYNMAVLKRWLQLAETQAMGSVRARVVLVQALHYAAPTVLAQEIAELLNVNITSFLQESMSSGTSVHDTNAASSTGHARHVPEDNESQTGSVGEAREGQGLPMASRQGADLGLEPSASPIPYYRMNRIPRGLCVIINNRNFYVADHPDAKKLKGRLGTEVDKAKLEDTFTNLNFLVITEDNCTDTQMIHLMTKMAAKDHRNFDCFVCCILTHGSLGALYGTNGMSVPTQDLTSPFRSQACPGLAGKPKLFFMQACQGNDYQEGQIMDIQRDCSMETDGPRERIPNEADFLLGYATVPGFVSFRSITEGSWYITKLTELLNNYAYSLDILDILTKVNNEVGQRNACSIYKQAPAPMYTLRKKLLFGHPG